MISCWSFLVLAACNGGQTGDENKLLEPAADAGGSDFFDAIARGPQADYDPARSVASLTESSERVALGTVTAVRDPDGAPSGRAWSYAVIEVAVSEALKGGDAETLHVMVPIGGVEDAPRLPDPPAGRVLVFLSSDIGDDGAAIVASPDWPDGQSLYAPTTPQGIVGEARDGSTIESAPDQSIFPDTFAESIEAVRDALR